MDRPRKDEVAIAVTGQSLIEHPFAARGSRASGAVADLIDEADVALTNVEVALRGRHGGIPQREHTLHTADPAVLDTLAEFGFNLLALASNHAFDLGPDGIRSTLEEVDNRGFSRAGIGLDRTDARRPGFIEGTNRRVGLVAANASPLPLGADARNATDDAPARAGTNFFAVEVSGDVACPSPEHLAEFTLDIARVASSGALAIAYVHQHYWVPDVATTPAWLQEVAHRCVEAGAHLVICHGPPMMHGLELSSGRPIFYGLGSFVFHTERPERYPGVAAWESVIANCSFDSQNNLRSLRLHPIVHGHHPALGGRGDRSGGPEVATGKTARELLTRYSVLSLQRHGTEIVVDDAVGLVGLASP